MTKTTLGSKVLFVPMLFLCIAGCQKGKPTFQALTPTPATPVTMNLTAKAAVKVDPKAASVDPRELMATKTFQTRPDAFKLMPVEEQFEDLQASERLLAGTSWNLNVVPTLEMDEVPPPPIIPVPNWRLAGVVVGNGVIALLDTGRIVYEVRPGSKVPGTDWRVESIDSDRAVLVRESNAVPKRFEVVLQGPIAGATGQAG